MSSLTQLHIEKLESLSADQIMVLARINQGLSDEQIAEQLQLRPAKVASLLTGIYTSLQCESGSPEECRISAARIYHQYGLERVPKSSIRHAESPDSDMEPDEGGPEMNEEATKAVLSEPVIEIASENLITPPPAPPRIDIASMVAKILQLSERRKEFLRYVVDDMTDEQIAQKMGLSKASPSAMFSSMCSDLGISLDLPRDKRRIYLKAAALRIVERVSESDSLLEAVAAEYPLKEVANRPQRPRPCKDIRPAFSDADMEQVVIKISRLTGRTREMMQCIAKDLDAATELRIAESSAGMYKNKLYSSLGLPSSLGSKERKRIVKEAYHRLLRQGRPTQTPGPALKPDPEQPAKEPVVPEKPAIIESIKNVVQEPQQPVEEPAAEPLKTESYHEPVELVRAAPARTPALNGHAAPISSYGPGVPIVLVDPDTILDVEVVSGRHETGLIASHIVRCKRAGFRPEIVVVYPTNDPNVTQSHLVFVKRQR